MGIMAPIVMQTTVSALAIPSTAVPAVPAVRTQVAVKVAMRVPAFMAVFAFVLSTVLKKLLGRARVILPPMGIAVADVKPRVTAAVLTVPGTLSTSAANAMPTPEVSCCAMLSFATMRITKIGQNNFVLHY
jgi:hypothetical protein